MEEIYVVTFHLFKPGELFYTIVGAYKTRNEAEKFCKDASDAYDETMHEDEDKTRLSHIYSNIESARKEYERIIRLGVNAWIYTYPVMD